MKKNLGIVKDKDKAKDPRTKDAAPQTHKLKIVRARRDAARAAAMITTANLKRTR